MEFERPYLRPVSRTSSSPYGSQTSLNMPTHRFNELSVFTDPKLKHTCKSPSRMSLEIQLMNKPTMQKAGAGGPSQSPVKDPFSVLAAKKLRLEQLKKEMATVEFEILELETNLKCSDKLDTDLDKKLDFGPDTFLAQGQSLSRKVSKLFLGGSTILAPAAPPHPLSSPKKVGDSFDNLQRKALNYFNNRLLPDVKEKLDQQQTELEAISKKGADLAKNLISSLSPKKKENIVMADVSFSLDQLGDLSLVDTSIILSEDSVVDIDDYESE